jgi:mRNA interferase RelE/StbE
MIDLTRRAQDFLQDLQPKQFKQVAKSIFALLKDPFPADCKHLSGHPGFRRIDVGEYRVCYEVSNGIVRVAVVGLRNDDAVYKELKRVDG